MLATKDLRAEHVVVTRMLDVLEAMAHRAAAGSQVDAVHLEGAIEFMDIFVDRCHHSKEEVVLFPTMRREGIEQSPGAIDGLLRDHDLSRALVRRLAAATDAIEAGGAGAGRELQSVVMEHSHMLRAHIEREELSFDLADQKLPDVEQAAMAEEYERIEREVVGATRHEEFHALVESLETRYLQQVLI